MKVIYLKTINPYFKEVKNGNKTFEIRKNDRDYNVGDILILEEFEKDKLTGQCVVVEVTYITDFMQHPGYIVMATKRLGR